MVSFRRKKQEAPQEPSTGHMTFDSIGPGLSLMLNFQEIEKELYATDTEIRGLLERRKVILARRKEIISEVSVQVIPEGLEDFITSHRQKATLPAGPDPPVPPAPAKKASSRPKKEVIEDD